MKDYSAEISARLEEARSRGSLGVDRTLERIGKARLLCVFGVGAISYPIVAALRRCTGLKIDLLCDNDPAKWGKTFHGGVPCLSPLELEKHRDDVAVVITTQHYADIYAQLSARGFREIFVVTEYRLLNRDYFRDEANLKTIGEKAMQLLDVLEDETSKRVASVLISNWLDFEITGPGYREIFTPDQYYPAGIVHLSGDESFVDGGAYNGDTLLQFIDRTGGAFDAIHAFELDGDNFRDMQANVARLERSQQERIRLYNLGILDEAREIAYETGGSGKQSTFINVIDAAGASGRTVRLADALDGQRVTFIKMDVEGAEPLALRGAEDIIRLQSPKMAICVYHRPEHLWEIPLYLKSLVPSYRIYLRHHTVLEYETVCYAVE